MPEPTQKDFICLSCPIVTGCNEESLFCALRWATNPNDAQRQVIKELSPQEVKAHLTAAQRAEQRRVYRRDHYERNRQRILNYQKDWRNEKTRRHQKEQLNAIT